MRLVFDPRADDELKHWARKDKKKAEKILRLLDEIIETPFTGTGKPEPLKYIYSGCWSRRIDKGHRLIYEVRHDSIRVLSCRYHDDV